MINNIPFLRKEVSTFIVLSAAILMVLLLASPLPLSNVLLQPVQAQTPVTFKTPTPAGGSDPCAGSPSTITFDAQGTASSSGDLKITSGTFNVTHTDEPLSYSGEITLAKFTNDSNGGGKLVLQGTVEHVSFPTLNCSMIQGSPYLIGAQCSTSNAAVDIFPTYTDQQGNAIFMDEFQGVVECSPPLGGGSTQPSSSSTSTTGTTITQDRDGDGIPDSSDNCPHNSHHRCYKEDTTTTQQQEQPSSSNRTGNLTR